jgi:hypothetical protein
MHTSEFTGPLTVGEPASGISRGTTPRAYATAWSGIYQGIRESEWVPGELVHWFTDGIIGETPQRCFAMPLSQFPPVASMACRINGLREEGLTELAAAGQAAEELRFTGTIRLRPEDGTQQILEYAAGFCTDKYATRAGAQL